MAKIYYICDWEHNKEKTWSGTCWGLFNALLKIVSIKEIDASAKKIKSIFYKIMVKIGLKRNDLNYAHIVSQRRHLREQVIKNDDTVIFQFQEYFSNADGFHSYIFKDLTVSYVDHMLKHLSDISEYSGFGYLSSKDIKKRYQMEQEYFKSCSGIFCMGEWLRQDCITRLGMNPKKVHAVGGGINLDVNRIKECAKTNNKILFVGRDFKRKGGYLVYQAFVELQKTLKNVELYVAGPSKDPINTPIEGYYFLGDCDSNRLSHYFNICDVFCMPSYFEAYGLVFIEALTYGLPCIGRNCYEMPYFIEDGITGYLIENDDITILSDKIKLLLFDEKIKQNVLSNRKYYINKYSWDEVAKRIKLIIEG